MVWSGDQHRELVAAGEKIRVIPFQSAVSTVHVFPANSVVHRLTAELPSSSPLFHINGFFWESATKMNWVSE